jgi:hypothetical protein
MEHAGKHAPSCPDAYGPDLEVVMPAEAPHIEPRGLLMRNAVAFILEVDKR